MEAALEGQTRAAELLIRRGANVNHQIKVHIQVYMCNACCV